MILIELNKWRLLFSKKNITYAKRTKSKGVEALKNFLSYAEKGKLLLSYAKIPYRSNQGIVDKICSVLEKAGYKYQKDVGHSKFKMDIAVLNPYNEDKYLMGIMLDGDSYRELLNTKDREIAQISVLKNLGWEIHRIWTIDWWDNRQKEIDKLLNLLDNKKQQAYEIEKSAVKSIKPVKEKQPSRETVGGNPIETRLGEDKIIFTQESKVEDKTDASSEQTKLNCRIEKTEIQIIPNSFITPQDTLKVANKLDEQNTPIFKEKKDIYSIETYLSAAVEIIPMSTADYILKENITKIMATLQEIIDTEAPISYNRLLKRTIRTFNISRVSTQITDATEKALKKIKAKSNKQNGVRFYWKEDQNAETYKVYRKDTELIDKRGIGDVCQQEIKNAVCITLQDKGPLTKENLIKETIKTMGYARSGAVLIEAVKQGIKYGCKTGEIVLHQDKTFAIVTSII